MQFFEKQELESSQIVLLTISRPKVLNALSEELILEGIEIFESLRKMKDLRVVILTGAGEKSFVAGADIQGLASADGEEGRRISKLGQKFFNLIETFPTPVIAAVNGFALGGGLELALACDLRYASTKAKLGLPEVSLGLIPGYGGTCRLPRLIGQGRAMEYIFTGAMYSAQEALEHGLLQGVFEADRLMDEVLSKAKLIASRAPLAIQSAKRSIQVGVNLDLVSSQMIEQAEFSAVCTTQDKIEGTTAFLEKRTAVFTGK